MRLKEGYAMTLKHSSVGQTTKIFACFPQVLAAIEVAMFENQVYKFSGQCVQLTHDLIVDEVAVGIR